MEVLITDKLSFKMSYVKSFYLHDSVRYKIK